MEQYIVYFIIAIGLSMDAFSLSIAYGINRPSNIKCYLMSISVGLFHLIMPIFGYIIGTTFVNKIQINTNIFVSLIFIILAIEMLLSKSTEKQEKITNIISILMYAFAVSIDSFSVGIALALKEEIIILACIIFALTSATFTLVGLFLGTKLSEKYEKKATYIGAIILFLIAIKTLL